LKNARGLALNASQTVPSVEKCEKNEVKRQPSGALVLGPFRSGTKF